MPEEKSPLNIKDALRLATKDEKFAAMLVYRPQDLRRQFNLSEEEVIRLTELGRSAQIAARAAGGAMYSAVEGETEWGETRD